MSRDHDTDNLIWRARSMAAHLPRWKWTGDAGRADLLEELADALEDMQEQLARVAALRTLAAPPQEET